MVAAGGRGAAKIFAAIDKRTLTGRGVVHIWVNGKGGDVKEVKAVGVKAVGVNLKL
jgi:hypothetical protein